MDEIDKTFLLEIERRVSPDCVITIDQVEYEIDYRFARQRIRLRYSHDMEQIFVVEPDGALTPIRLLNKQENAIIKPLNIITADAVMQAINDCELG